MKYDDLHKQDIVYFFLCDGFIKIGNFGGDIPTGAHIIFCVWHNLILL